MKKKNKGNGLETVFDMTYPKYGSESIYDIDSYDGIRVGDECYYYGQRVRVMSLTKISGGTRCDVELVTPGNGVNSWAGSAENLRKL